MKSIPSTTLIALGVVGIGGFFVGRISSSGPSLGASISNVSDAQADRATSRGATADASSKEKSRTARAARAVAGSSSGGLKRLEAIVRGANALDRNRALLAFIDQLAPEDFEDAVERFRSLDLGDDRDGEFALLLSAWAKLDPLSALAYARENTNGGFATNTILTSWATADPEAAIQWAKANHEGEDGNEFFAGIIRGLAGTDPARATELLTSMPRGDERGDALEEMVPHMLKDGPAAAQMWVSSIGDPILRNGLMNEMAEPMAAIDPKSTAAWLLANPSEASTRRMDEVFEEWVQKNPQEALTSFDALPAGELRTKALEGLVGSVAKENPKAAAAMLDRFPNDVNDEVVQTVVWDSFRNDPNTAADQISRISNEAQRDQMYRRALGRWMGRDPASAQAWLQKNPVSENVQNHLARQQAERQP